MIRVYSRRQFISNTKYSSQNFDKTLTRLVTLIEILIERNKEFASILNFLKITSKNRGNRLLLLLLSDSLYLCDSHTSMILFLLLQLFFCINSKKMYSGENSYCFHKSVISATYVRLRISLFLIRSRKEHLS